MKIAFPDDFPDRLSPMLVKELRQGLRTRAFIGVFLTLQIILGIILLGAGTTSTSDQAGNTISAIIFVFFSIAVIIIQPLRGMGALSSEIKGNTIDMMVLTRLSAWRVVVGKWSAIVSQSALMMITIIPYLILRYFFGGMNLVGEMVLILLILISSATLTAITVGLSASPSVILRSIIPILAVPFGTYALFGILVFSRIGGGGSFVDFFSLESQESRIAIGIFVICCLYYGFFMLSIGTTLIAPLANNYSTFRRMVALVMTVVATVLCVMHVDEIEALIAIFSLIFTPVFIISLTEYNILVPPVMKKFRRYGFLGRVSGIFLLPGWASGVFFCYLLLAIASVSFYGIHIPSYDEELVTVTIALIGGWIFPGLLVYFFKMQGPARVSNYILLSAAIGIISLTLLAISESLSSPGFLWLFVWLPPVSLIMIENHQIDENSVLVCTALINMLYLLTFLVLAIRHYRDSIQSLHDSQSND
ncbi:MAG: hypothetical protein RL346_876 [Verrucomicrobiota bacterium]|jgi:hypothetical protein